MHHSYTAQAEAITTLKEESSEGLDEHDSVTWPLRRSACIMLIHHPISMQDFQDENGINQPQSHSPESSIQA